MIKPQTLKGFRDFLPNDARKRQYVISTLKQVFESFGFEPLETPALEYEEVLTGKYGDEGDKLMYRFEDNGKRRVALRYDQTVPLSRVVAQYQNDITFPFKRYQIQPVWRAENTQKGRSREFLQCDIDSVGTKSSTSDAEILAAIYESFIKLGFASVRILINDRSVFTKIGQELSVREQDLPAVIRAIDKLKKVGRDRVIDEIVQLGYEAEQSAKIISSIEEIQPPEMIKEIVSNAIGLGVAEDALLFFPTLARGLDYYTGIIIEVEIPEYTAGSLGGGGRYDNLIGMFAGREIPAVGFAFGFDRVIEAMDQLALFPADLQTLSILVTIFSLELKKQSIALSSQLRSSNINTELYLDEHAKVEKQLKYANQKGIPYVAIIGPDEAAKNIVQLKNMETRVQKEVTVEELIEIISHS
jgi:histidyl-tRNA synthetase